MNKTLAALVLALSLSGCASYNYAVKLGKDPKPKTCEFFRGRGFETETNFWNQQAQVGVNLFDLRKKTSAYAGIGIPYSLRDLPIVIGKEGFAVYASMSDVGLNMKGVSIGLAEPKIGTPLMGVGPNGFSFISRTAVPFYLLSKAPKLVEIASADSDTARKMLAKTVEGMVLRDLVPFYTVRDGFYDFKRVFSINSSVSGENLEEILKEFHTDSNSKALNLIESNIDNYPELRGDLKFLYDQRLLAESFLFLKRDIKDMADVHDKVTQNIIASQKSIDALLSSPSFTGPAPRLENPDFAIPDSWEKKAMEESFHHSDYWSYLTDLYHVSNLSNNTFRVDMKDGCSIDMHGTYLFLADDKTTDSIFNSFLGSIEGYRKKGFARVMTETQKSFDDALDSLGNKRLFKKSFERLYYSMHYWTGIQNNFSNQRLAQLSYYLGSRGREKLAKRFASVEQVPQIPDQLTDLVEYMKGIYDLVKKDDYPASESYCDWEDSDKLVDLKKTVVNLYHLENTMQRLDRNGRAFQVYSQIHQHYRAALEHHLEQYPSEFAYHWQKASDTYKRDTKKFWKLARKANSSYKLGYSRKQLKAMQSQLSPKVMIDFYNQLAGTKKAKPADLIPMRTVLQSSVDSLLYDIQAGRLGFHGQQLGPCPRTGF